MSFEIECLVLKNNKSNKVDGEARETEHFCYICVKKNDAEKVCEQNWEKVKEEILKEQSEDLEDEDEGSGEIDFDDYEEK